MGWILIIIVAIIAFKLIRERQYEKLQTEILKELGLYNWNAISYFDEYVTVKSRQALEKLKCTQSQGHNEIPKT